MSTRDDRCPPATELSQLTEARPGSLEAWEPEALSPEETFREVHDLRVHPIELKMQNRERRRAHTELDAKRGRYFGLYDRRLCPREQRGADPRVKANLTAAALLGMARGMLGRQPLTGFILPDDQDAYYQYLKNPFAIGAP